MTKYIIAIFVLSLHFVGSASVVSADENAPKGFSPRIIEIIEKTIDFVDRRVPVIAGTGGNSTQEAIELTQTASELGADYALIVTPYYNKPNQEGLFQHFIKIADSVEIPQILYNVPSRTACDLSPQTVSRLAEHQNIIGIKEALDSSERLSELIRISQSIGEQKNFSKLCTPENKTLIMLEVILDYKDEEWKWKGEQWRTKVEKELGFLYDDTLREGLQKLIDWRKSVGIDKA